MQVRGLKLGTGILSNDNKYIYHISIIDYLQKYNLNKKLERLYKISSGASPSGLSSINVRAYKRRFLEFMKDKVFNYGFHHAIDVIKLNKNLDK